MKLFFVAFHLLTDNFFVYKKTVLFFVAKKNDEIKQQLCRSVFLDATFVLRATSSLFFLQCFNIFLAQSDLKWIWFNSYLAFHVFLLS